MASNTISQATGMFSNCGPGVDTYELAYNCGGPSCGTITGFQGVNCNSDGGAAVSCSNNVKCPPGIKSFQSNFTFSQNAPDPLEPAQNEWDNLIPQHQSVMMANCAKFTVDSDGTKDGTEVNNGGIEENCPMGVKEVPVATAGLGPATSNGSGASSVASTKGGSATNLAGSSPTTAQESIATNPAASDLTSTKGNTATGTAASDSTDFASTKSSTTQGGTATNSATHGIESMSSKTNAATSSTSSSTPAPGSGAPDVFPGASSRSSPSKHALFLSLLLGLMLLLPGTQASAIDPRRRKELRARAELRVRAVSDKVRAFATNFGDDLAQQANAQGQNGETFAHNLVADVVSSVCGGYFNGESPATFAPPILGDCVKSIYGGDALPQPGARFYAVFGATLLCDYAVSEAFPLGAEFFADGCEGLQDLAKKISPSTTAEPSESPSVTDSPATDVSSAIQNNPPASVASEPAPSSSATAPASTSNPPVVDPSELVIPSSPLASLPPSVSSPVDTPDIPSPTLGDEEPPTSTPSTDIPNLPILDTPTTPALEVTPSIAPPESPVLTPTEPPISTPVLPISTPVEPPISTPASPVSTPVEPPVTPPISTPEPPIVSPPISTPESPVVDPPTPTPDPPVVSPNTTTPSSPDPTPSCSSETPDYCPDFGCTYFDRDPLNCGDCNNTCSSGVCSGGHCICPEGTVLDNSSNVCIDPASWSCPPNSTLVEGSEACTCDKEGELWNAETNTCDVVISIPCPPNSTWMEESNECTCADPDNYTWDVESQTCVPRVVVSPCPSNSTWIPESNECTCADGDNYTWDADSRACVPRAIDPPCPPNSTWMSESRECTCADGDNYTWDPESATCVPRVVDPPCPPNSTLLEATGECTCPSGQIWNNDTRACFCPSALISCNPPIIDTPCPPNSSWIPETQTCSCLDGGAWSTELGECVSSSTTVPGFCLGDLTSCNGTCVDPQYDNDNCGVCGNFCGTGRTCDDYTCIDDVYPSPIDSTLVVLTVAPTITAAAASSLAASAMPTPTLAQDGCSPPCTNGYACVNSTCHADAAAFIFSGLGGT